MGRGLRCGLRKSSADLIRFFVESGLEAKDRGYAAIRISISIVKNPSRISGSFRLALPTLVLCGRHPTREVCQTDPEGER
jgi:hypothetical protein